jgi:hypothetical protein
MQTLMHPVGDGLWKVWPREEPEKAVEVTAHTAYSAYEQAIPKLGPLSFASVEVELLKDLTPASN